MANQQTPQLDTLIEDCLLHVHKFLGPLKVGNLSEASVRLAKFPSNNIYKKYENCHLLVIINYPALESFPETQWPEHPSLNFGRHSILNPWYRSLSRSGIKMVSQSWGAADEKFPFQNNRDQWASANGMVDQTCDIERLHWDQRDMVESTRILDGRQYPDDRQ